MTPRPPKVVEVEHIHVPLVRVREQAVVVVERLRRLGVATFRTLVADAPDTLHVVARFLVLLDLFRENAVGFDQAEALGELRVRWTAGEYTATGVGTEFDEPRPPDTPDGAGDRPGRARRRRPGTTEEHTP
jgi:segregation and condensation protein A